MNPVQNLLLPPSVQLGVLSGSFPSAALCCESLNALPLSTWCTPFKVPHVKQKSENGFVFGVGKTKVTFGATGVGISNDGGNKLGTFNACSTGADIFTVGAVTGSLYTSFGFIDASTFITVKGSCFGDVLAIP